MTGPEVSVLLPVRDAAATVAAALRSVLRQRGAAWECIVVDDGSLDGSAEVVRRTAAADPRVRLLRPPRRGLVPALRLALACARAPVVARMDADDWMHRDRLALQLDALHADPRLAGVGTHVRIFPRRDLRDGRRAYERWLNGLRTPEQVARDAYVECPLAHPTLALRTAVARRLPWRERGWPEDYDLVLRLLAAGHRLGVVPRRLLGWRDAPGRLSRRSPVYALERFTACKAHHLSTGLLARHDRYVLWGHGDTGRALRRALTRHGRTPSHVVEVHPGRVGQRIHGAPVVRPEALPGLRGRPLVVSVAGEGPRREIRAALEAMAFRELRDYVCAA